MTAPLIHRPRRAIPASKLLDAVGADLAQIHAEDGLTWADVGRVMGKSESQAAKYADATAEMPLTAYLFAKQEWGTRLTGRVTALMSRHRAAFDDAEVLPELLGCAKGLAEALGDGRICPRDLHVNRRDIEQAISALQGLLTKVEGEPV